MKNQRFKRRARFIASAKVCLALAVVLASSAALADLPAENKCIHHEAHESVTFFLVDRSDKLTDTSGLQQTLSALKEMVRPGERLVVGESTGKLSETRIILDLVRPAQTLWDSVMKIRAKEKVFMGCFGEMEAGVLKQDETHKTSAIIETLSFVSNILSADTAKSKRLVMYSDMAQNSDALSFLAGKTIDPDAALKKVEKDQMVVKLNSAEVYVGGAGIGVTDDKARKIEQFWRKYFDQAGATVKSYGPIFIGA